MAAVSDIEDKLPIILKSNISGLLVRIDSISPDNEGIGTVVGDGDGVNLSGHRVGDHVTTWYLENFAIFKG